MLTMFEWRVLRRTERERERSNRRLEENKQEGFRVVLLPLSFIVIVMRGKILRPEKKGSKGRMKNFVMRSFTICTLQQLLIG